MTLKELKEQIDYTIGEQTGPVVCLFEVTDNLSIDILYQEFIKLFPEFNSKQFIGLDMSLPISYFKDTKSTYLKNIAHFHKIEEVLGIYTGRSLREEGTKWTSGINMSRELIFRDFNFMSFFWIHSKHKRTFVNTMPDFSHWITNNYRIDAY